MKVLLARHGNTEENNTGVHQSPDTPLSKEGILQSMALAKKLNGAAIDLIISSPYSRARQTAEIISKELKKPIEYGDSLAEVVSPREFISKRTDDPEVEKNHKRDAEKRKKIQNGAILARKTLKISWKGLPDSSRAWKAWTMGLFL